jgi:D-3-phosphoglycerate dehydrogenase
MMKIYILDAFHPAGIELAKQHAEVICWPDPAISNWPEEADGVMVRMTPITGEQILRAKNLKVICKQGVGFETIDVATAHKMGIPVCRTPGINSEAVAEMALALSLDVARRTSRFDRMLRRGEKIIRPQHLGIEMHGKTIGIVGMGNIGRNVAKKWIGAFDAKILALDPNAPPDRWIDIPHHRCSNLNELLPQVDLLSLHIPMRESNRHIIGAKEIALMKPNAILINVSRGGLIDEAALFTSLKNGHLFGAGLDVFEVEPPPPDYPLLSLENVVATPHAAGGTEETQERSALQVAQQVIDVLAGKPPTNQVI